MSFTIREKITIEESKSANNPPYSDPDDFSLPTVTIVPIDYATDVILGIPISNENIQANSPILQNVQIIKQASEFSTVSLRVAKFNKMNAKTTSERLFVRHYLKALQASNDLYSTGINNLYTAPVSDQVALVTLGHTIDTPALDPEDWFSNSAITGQGGSNPTYKGPAMILPTTSKHKLPAYLRHEVQTNYDSINKKMYLNLYRDRYWTNDPTQVFDYAITKYTILDAITNLLAGLKKETTSHTNAGDYASINFAFNFNTQTDEIYYSGIPIELFPLIGYLYTVNNYDRITEKPLYKININSTEILVDSRGSKYTLPSTRVDNTAVQAS